METVRIKKMTDDVGKGFFAKLFGKKALVNRTGEINELTIIFFTDGNDTCN